MKEGPDISIVAALIGNPACANMLMALMAGPALTATELAQEAVVLGVGDLGAVLDVVEVVVPVDGLAERLDRSGGVL